MTHCGVVWPGSRSSPRGHSSLGATASPGPSVSVLDGQDRDLAAFHGKMQAGLLRDMPEDDLFAPLLSLHLLIEGGPEIHVPGDAIPGTPLDLIDDMAMRLDEAANQRQELGES